MRSLTASITVQALIPLLCVSTLSSFAWPQRLEDSSLRSEESTDYYEKWLKQDVNLIITEEERAVFEQLTTEDEKEQFIEQFWFRRDPDPLTTHNEFKEEHYRRIAYANEHFSSGLPGSMSDRGKIYILHGPPTEVESHPAGGTYDRPVSEGGGTTATFPFEIWRYRHIEGVGSDIMLEFVDPSVSGEYRLALFPEEKDALLNVPGAGLTFAEEMGLANKSERPWFSPGNDHYPRIGQTFRDNPFTRYERYALVQRASKIDYPDLRELIKVNVNFETFPITVEEHYFRLNGQQAIVSLNLQFANSELNFEREGENFVARIAVYGLVTTMVNRVIAEFEEDLFASYPSRILSAGRQQQSIFQKLLVLELGKPHKLDFIVKDLTSGKIGLTRKALRPPAYGENTLEASSLIMAEKIEELVSVPDTEEMFVLGNVKVKPNLTRRFPVGSPVSLYFQIYNAVIDQDKLEPSIAITYRLVQDGETVKQVTDHGSESYDFFSGSRVVVVKHLEVEGVGPGDYRLIIEVRDKIGNQRTHLEERFTLKPS